MATRTSLRSLSRATQLLGPRRPWTCSSCTHGWAIPRRGVATTPQKSKKPYYVTTPIFYVNAGRSCTILRLLLLKANAFPNIAPHVGHLYTMVIADIMKRWQVVLGNTDAQLLTGTDEHGMKVIYTSNGLGSFMVADMTTRFNKLLPKLAWTHRHFAT